MLDKKLLRSKKFWIKTMLVIILITVFFLYVAARANILSITYDEAYTYDHFVSEGWKKILTYNADSPTNNHFLNSILSKMSILLFGDREFTLRLPNVVAFIPFSLSIYLFLKKLLPFFFAFSGVLLIVSNPFLLDYFTLARGYGLAICFWSISMVFFIQLIKDPLNSKLRDKIGFGSFILLSVLSNLVFMNLLIPLYLLFLVRYYLEQENEQFIERALKVIKSNLTLLITGLISTIFFLVVTLFLRSKGQLYFGGDSNFVSDSIRSLIDFSLYSSTTSLPVANYLILFVLAIIVVACILIILKKTNFLLSISTYLFIFIGVSTTLQFYLLRNLYLLERTAIFLIPLFIFVLLGTLYQIYRLIGVEISYFLTAIGVFAVLINFLSIGNLYYMDSFRFDYPSKQISELITMPEYADKDIYLSRKLSSSMVYYLNKREVNNRIFIFDFKNELEFGRGIYYSTDRDFNRISGDKNLLYQNDFAQTRLFILD